MQKTDTTKYYARQICDRILESALGINLVNNWWNSHNKAFDTSPIILWETDYKRVYNYLLDQLNGYYS